MRQAGALQAVEGIADRVVIMLATGRSLSRAVANLVRHRQGTGDPDLAPAIDHLGDAVESLRTWVLGDGAVEEPRDRALQAAAEASARLPASTSTAVLIGQIRSVTIDVLRATGLNQEDAVAALEAGAGRADGLGAS